MSSTPKPPKMYEDFLARYPKLDQAWNLTREAEAEGPLDEKSRRLIKVGIAAGAMKQGALRSCVRKALAAGVSADEIFQVLALGASTVGFPSTVAAFSWVKELLD